MAERIISFILAIVLFNKQLLKWLKPIIIVLIVIAIIMVCTFSRWWPEISGAVKSVLGVSSKTEVVQEQKDVSPLPKEPASLAPSIEYIETGVNTVTMSLNGEELIIAVDAQDDVISNIQLCDANGNVISAKPMEEAGYFAIDDARFYNYAKIALVYDGTTYYIQVITGDNSNGEMPWTFIRQDGEMYFYPDTHRPVKLEKVETIGFKNNPGLGSGRGNIWSHSIPLLKHTIIKGYGADTYCAVYPQHDYAAKWTNSNNSSGSNHSNLYLIVDKPHNMYLHAAIGTGCISLLALLALYGIYLVQSFKLFWKRDMENDFILFTGAGTFLGVTGFLVAGLVDDSTVSVMPLFYTMLGMGIAINMIIKRRDEKSAK